MKEKVSSADLPNYCPYIIIEKNVSSEGNFLDLEYILKIPYSFGIKVLLISGFYKTKAGITVSYYDNRRS